MTGTDRTAGGPLRTADLRAVVEAVDPDWELRSATAVERGVTAVYRVTVGTPAGPRDCVLKAAPGEPAHPVGVEARVLALLDRRTALPVPTVFGAVDAHESASASASASVPAPAPSMLVEALPGRSVGIGAVGTLAPATLERIARETGAHLARLHAVDAVDAYGVLDPRGGPFRGGRPRGVPGEVGVDGDENWPSLFEEYASGTVERHRETAFDDHTSRLRSALRAELAALDDADGPVLGRVEGGLHNLLFDADTGEVTGVIDWAASTACAPAYDLVCVERSLAGNVHAVLPEVPDRSRRVRTALLDGYGSVRPLPDGVTDHRRLYELFACAQRMIAQDMGVTTVPDDRADAAERGLVERLEALL